MITQTKDNEKHQLLTRIFTFSIYLYGDVEFF